MPDKKRQRIAKALEQAIAGAFPGETLLTELVRVWVGYVTTPAPNCAVCARSIHGNLAVEPGGLNLRLLYGKDAGTHAVCSPCFDAARDTWAKEASDLGAWKMPEGRPRWDMIHAQLERVLALLPEEDAAVARECFTKHPDSPEEGTCTLCKTKGPVIKGRAGGLCEKCGRQGRFLMHDLAARGELERPDTRCPRCFSTNVATGVVGIEFTEMTCLACGNNEICDVWQLSDWRG